MTKNKPILGFVGNMFVTSKEGKVLLSGIKVGDSVLTQSGRFCKVRNIVVGKAKTTIVKIGLTDTIECSVNQKFYKKEVKNDIWAKTSELTKSSFLLSYELMPPKSVGVTMYPFVSSKATGISKDVYSLEISGEENSYLINNILVQSSQA